MLSAMLLAVVMSSWDCDYDQEQWRKEQLDAPCTLVAKGGPAAQRAAFKKSWALSDEGAACAREAALLKRDAPGTRKRWQSCLEKEPEAFPLWFGFVEAEIYDEAQEEDWVALESLLERQTKAVAIAERLLGLQFPPSVFCGRIILRKQPERLTEVLANPAVLGGPGLELALPLIDTGAKRSPPFSKQEWVALGTAALEGALPEHPQLAAEVWASLPADVREALKVQPLWDYYVTSDEPRHARPARDLSRYLALALSIAGDTEAARAIVRSRRARDAGVDPGHRERDDEFLAAVLDFQLEGRRKLSPWDAAIAFSGARLESSEALVAIIPFLSPYESFAQGQLEYALRPVDEDRPRRTSVVEFRMKAAHDIALSRLRTLVISSPDAGTPEAAADAGDPGPVLAPSPFDERKTPYRGKAGSPPGRGSGKPPKMFWPVRSEASAGRLAVLATSQRLDPVGEVSPGGYWLLVSKDRGSTWEQLYLGLRVNRPYLANGSSTVPLLAGDTVRLDVSESPIVEETISFPPIGTQTEAGRQHVILEATLADLRKDSDGDGLSDVVEGRLLLDPKKRDSDGDGIADGDDATPRLADNLAATPRAEVLNAFFEEMAGGKHKQPGVVLSPARGDAGESLCDALGPLRPAQLDDVSFLVGSPTELAGLRPLARVVTLSQAELRAATKAFGTFYPMKVDVTFSNDGKHAYIKWSESWRGGSFRADRDEKGRWVLGSLGGWIT